MQHNGYTECLPDRAAVLLHVTELTAVGQRMMNNDSGRKQWSEQILKVWMECCSSFRLALAPSWR